MKSTKVLMIGCLATVLMVTAVLAQDAADQAAAMEAWTKAAVPGEFHEFFAKKTGNWKLATKMWMQPGADPMESESKADVKMIIGGRFMMENVEGESMGQPFEGLHILGYDNTTGTVTSVWYDNFGTVTTVMTGKYEKPGDPLELHGTMIDAMSGMEMKIRSVTTFVSDDEQHMEYFFTTPMGEMKGMEMVSTRVK